MDFTGARWDFLNYCKYDTAVYLVFLVKPLFFSWGLNGSKPLSFLLTLEWTIFATLALAVSAQYIFVQAFRPGKLNSCVNTTLYLGITHCPEREGKSAQICCNSDIAQALLWPVIPFL